MKNNRVHPLVEAAIRKQFPTAQDFCWFYNEKGPGLQFDLHERYVEYIKLEELTRILGSKNITIEHTFHQLAITTLNISRILNMPSDDMP